MGGWNTTLPNTTPIKTQKSQEVTNSLEKLIIVKEIFQDISK
jgi:hypothetical protein